MKRFPTVAALLLLLGSCRGATAETVADVDLRAAYCLAVATAQEARNQDELRRAAENGSGDTLKLAIKLAQERKVRLEKHLTAKGLLPATETSAVTAAQERGSQDVETCERDVKSNPYKACSDECMARLRAADQRLICVTGCPAPEACRRVKKCLEKFLP